ncbi:hypothetical protein CLG_B0247 [Clostridium botulinum D str. 1873]|uniref:Uncharacterized protein n=1 Tax=Clostridium botulinum D str. 1873 TaxID=592027 RepID=A0A9P2LM74_CLOBO|nr:hypothetical protein CLG_B0247 [Clostridium botulinum D str. 1873]
MNNENVRKIILQLIVCVLLLIFLSIYKYFLNKNNTLSI